MVSYGRERPTETVGTRLPAMIVSCGSNRPPAEQRAKPDRKTLRAQWFREPSGTRRTHPPLGIAPPVDDHRPDRCQPHRHYSTRNTHPTHHCELSVVDIREARNRPHECNEAGLLVSSPASFALQPRVTGR